MSEQLRTFLKYVGTRLEDSDDDFGDPYVKKLQRTVHKIKNDRKMGERYMVFQEMLKDEREEGRKEGRKEGVVRSIENILTAKGFDPGEDRMKRIRDEKDIEVLDAFLVTMVKINNLEELVQYMDDVFKKQIID